MGKSYRRKTVRKTVRKGGKKSKSRNGIKKNKTRKNHVAGAKIPKKEQQLLALKDFMKEIDEYKRKHGDVDIDEFEQDMKTLEAKITTARNNNVINAKQFNMLQQEIEISIALAYDHEKYGSPPSSSSSVDAFSDDEF